MSEKSLKNTVSVAVRLTLWGPRCFWGPWDVLTCCDICAFFRCL